MLRRAIVIAMRESVWRENGDHFVKMDRELQKGVKDSDKKSEEFIEREYQKRERSECQVSLGTYIIVSSINKGILICICFVRSVYRNASWK